MVTTVITVTIVTQVTMVTTVSKVTIVPLVTSKKCIILSSSFSFSVCFLNFSLSDFQNVCFFELFRISVSFE